MFAATSPIATITIAASTLTPSNSTRQLPIWLSEAPASDSVSVSAAELAKARSIAAITAGIDREESTFTQKTLT